MDDDLQDIRNENDRLSRRVEDLLFEVRRLNDLLAAYQGEPDWRDRTQ